MRCLMQCGFVQFPHFRAFFFFLFTTSTVVISLAYVRTCLQTEKILIGAQITETNDYKRRQYGACNLNRWPRPRAAVAAYFTDPPGKPDAYFGLRYDKLPGVFETKPSPL